MQRALNVLFGSTNSELGTTHATHRQLVANPISGHNSKIPERAFDISSSSFEARDVNYCKGVDKFD